MSGICGEHCSKYAKGPLSRREELGNVEVRESAKYELYDIYRLYRTTSQQRMFDPFPFSAGALSSHDPDDVGAVLDGVTYAMDKSGGLIFTVLCRDVIDAVEALRLNVEALSMFFAAVSVVVFENDSADGTREAIKKWASETGKGSYNVDLMECEEAPNCLFHDIHRYNTAGEVSASLVGKMAIYRNRVLDYILESPLYTSYSHMIVLDMDLGVSFSPFGLLHSLGKMPDNAVASSGRGIIDGSFGMLVTPYDYGAFHAKQPYSSWSVKVATAMHKKFCEMEPPGTQWRHLCESVSPFKLFLVLFFDWSGSELYAADSAFNGAVLYPLDTVRDAKYDAGSDGQRCEHVGFNLSLKRPLYVNPKWDWYQDPTHPAGTTGAQSWILIKEVISSLKTTLLSSVPQLITMFFVVSLTMLFNARVVYPVLKALWHLF